MIKLFRKVRQSLLNEGKTKKYIAYALGEIFLVMIGILLALQVNNWNEQRKQHHSLKMVVNTLIADLQQDSIDLKHDMEEINNQISKLDDFRIRLSKPSATIDTVAQIARFEYIPFFNPSNELNRNTIISLLSTGNLDYFDEPIKNEILNLNTLQLNSIKIMDENVQIFLSVQTSTGIIPQSEHPLFDNAVIRGHLLDEYWNNYNKKDLLNKMMITLSHKTMMHYIVNMTKDELYKETLRMLDLLNSYQKTL